MKIKICLSLSYSWWFPRIALALVFAWVSVLGGSTVVYVQTLLHPVCSPSVSTLEGYQSITLNAPDGTKLSARYRPPHNGGLIVLLGGHGGNRDAMMVEAGNLSSVGYGILALEQRGCSGALATLGYRETQDVILAVDHALQQPGVEWVGALGFSAGGVAVIRAAAQDARIRAVVAEGNYANLMEEMSPKPGGKMAWLEGQLHPLAAGFYALITGVWPGDVNPEADLAQISPRPVLLIHGEYEIECSRGDRQFESARQPKELWVVPGAGHGGYAQAQPVEYGQRLVAFFEITRDLK